MLSTTPAHPSAHRPTRPKISPRVQPIVPASASALDGAFTRASWIGPPDGNDHPAFWEFSVEFAWPGGELILHVTADQRFQLRLDDHAVARGPECGTLQRWHYHTIRIELPAGAHRLHALVWSLGDVSPYAHISLRPAFLLAAEGAAHGLLTTGVAPWRVARRQDFGVVTTRNLPGSHLIGPSFDLDPSRPPGPAVSPEMLSPARPQQINGRLLPHWRLVAGELPQPSLAPWTHWRARAIGDEWLIGDAVIPPAWCQDPDTTAAFDLACGRPVIVAPHRTLTVLLDAEDIVTVYPGLETSGGRGAVVDLSWAESLAHKTSVIDNIAVTIKGHRDEVAGKRFYGFGDTFHPPGRFHRFETPWWRAGRYLLVRIRTDAEPLRLERILCLNTGYEFASHARFECNDPAFQPMLALCERGLRATCHEVYADSPAYEQLMYAGDARVEMLVHRCLETDDRLARKAVDLFGQSRHAGAGWTWSRCPSRLGQVIPSFSLIYVLMVEDFMRWRDHPAFVRSQLPAMRSVLDLVESHLDADGLLAGLPGWGFVDWHEDWPNGVPPSDGAGRSTPVNLFYVLALQAAARVEQALGSPTRAIHLTAIAGRVAAGIRAHCFDVAAGLFSDAPGVSAYSEQTQALAVLAIGRDVEEKRAWLAAARAARAMLTPSSYYFDHYVFEAHREARDPAFHARLQRWTELVAKGLRTPIELQEPSRSDCHGWASHPLFHAYATVAGIRPSESGPAVVNIAPLPGPLRSLRVTLPWIGGDIALSLEFDGEQVRGELNLPPGVSGEFVYHRLTRPLVAGRNIL